MVNQFEKIGKGGKEIYVPNFTRSPYDREDVEWLLRADYMNGHSNILMFYESGFPIVGNDFLKIKTYAETYKDKYKKEIVLDGFHEEDRKKIEKLSELSVKANSVLDFSLPANFKAFLEIAIEAAEICGSESVWKFKERLQELL